MTYNETLDYLFHQTPIFQHQGPNAYKAGLDNIRALDALFGHPHQSFPSIHIAGTNGKGSVSNITASVLQEAGFKVGLYTSPHLKDFRERIRVNGTPIPEEEVIRFVTAFQQANRLEAENATKLEPSFFELTTEMAFEWFKQQQVDVSVIEVGLGGRLDSTNILQPVASVITNISLDHTDLLGDTPEKIAFEKAGILKRDVPAVIGKAAGAVREVFEQRAEEVGTKLWFAAEAFQTALTTDAHNQTLISCTSELHAYNDIPCALSGNYQQENAATVLTLVEQLRKAGWNIPDKAVYAGFSKVLANTGLRGRWETLSAQPHIICDTGHNVAGIQFVVEQLRQAPHNRLHFVIGMVGDKDINGVLSLLPKDAIYYFTKASIPRALPETKLAELAAKYGLHGTTYPTVQVAYDTAQKQCQPDDLIFVGGSTFVVAEVI